MRTTHLYVIHDLELDEYVRNRYTVVIISIRLTSKYYIQTFTGVPQRSDIYSIYY